MDNNQETNLTEQPVLVQEATTAPVVEEVLSEEVKPVETPKLFTQEELDIAIGKRLYKEQRKWEREKAERKLEEQSNQLPAEIPSIENFSSPDAYAEVLALRKAEEIINQREQNKRQSEILEKYYDKEEEAIEKYADFKQVVYNDDLPITDDMAVTIRSSDIGPDIAYYLGSNPKEAARISRLTPLMQAKELGKIEATLSSNPLVKKTSSAPPPIAPIAARSSGLPSYDTTDPRSVQNMSTTEWIIAERKRQAKKWEAQRG
jgi:hypothetical protein